MDRKEISRIVFRPNFVEIGRLFGLLQRQKTLPVHTTGHAIINVAIALMYSHKVSWILIVFQDGRRDLTRYFSAARVNRLDERSGLLRILTAKIRIITYRNICSISQRIMHSVHTLLWFIMIQHRLFQLLSIHGCFTGNDAIGWWAGAKYMGK